MHEFITWTKNGPLRRNIFLLSHVIVVNI